MSKPKIAVLIDWYLPGTKAGGPVRSIYSLITLLKNDFDFYLITTNTDLGSNEPYREIAADTVFEKEGLHYFYFSSSELHTDRVLSLLKQINPDLIYLNSFWSYSFSIAIAKLKRKALIQSPVLLAPRGMLGKGAMSIKPIKKRIYLLLAKTLNWYRNIMFHATQQQERSDILLQFPNATIRVAPNVNASPATENTSVKLPGKLRLFFLSRVAAVKNLHTAIELLGQLPADCSVDYDIYGNLEDRDYWAQCEALIAKLPPNIRVSYKREIPFYDVQRVISGYHFLLMPTLNENYGHSIVESLLSGCPAIISDQTPWTDLEAHNAGYAIALKDRSKFISALTSAARMDQPAFIATSRAANAYISRNINLRAIADQYKNMFHDSIENRPVQF